MRILIIGAGGVGGYLGARLAHAGADVTIVARGEHGRLLRERGLVIDGPDGRETIALPAVVADVATITTRFDVVLLAVKWPELEQVCDALPNLIAPNGVVAPLLNGLTSEDVVAKYVGAQRTLAAVAYMSAGITEPGAIYVHGHTRVGLAAYRPGQDAEIAAISGLLERAKVPVQRSEDYRAMLWQKMIWNAPLNAICALTRKPAGVCVELLEPLVRRAMNEVIAVAAADGVSLPPQLVDAMLHTTRRDFPRTEPSMLQDVRKGRPTEVDILQGEVVTRATQHGVDVPVLTTLAGLIRGLERAD
jgi:2-dehydropantoate 2-reductase